MVAIWAEPGASERMCAGAAGAARPGWLGGTTAARFTMEPGWSWSECVKPVAGTENCQHRHVGVVQSGRMRVTHDDGSVLEIGPGEPYVIEPGHDAEIVGDERFVGFEFEPHAAEEYARR